MERMKTVLNVVYLNKQFLGLNAVHYSYKTFKSFERFHRHATTYKKKNQLEEATSILIRCQVVLLKTVHVTTVLIMEFHGGNNQNSELFFIARS